MIIKVGNFYYGLELLLAFTIMILCYVFLRNKSSKYQYRFLLIWSFVGFGLHFLKQFIYWDINMLGRSTAENICAVSTLIFPFIMLKKKKTILHDFMFFIGIIGGLAGLLYPTEAIGRMIYDFETLRFYFCHMSLFAIPLLLAVFRLQTPRIEKWYLIPLCFLGYELIICINTAFLTFTGLATREGFTAFELFISRQYLNNSFVFGPTPDMGILSAFMDGLALPFMKVDIFNINHGDLFYWPVLWLLVPSYVLFSPLYILFTIPYYKEASSQIELKFQYSK
ncbi:MAG TPA: hypothetical protein VIK67_00300 [Acholeplasma sp.]